MICPKCKSEAIPALFARYGGVISSSCNCDYGKPEKCPECKNLLIKFYGEKQVEVYCRWCDYERVDKHVDKHEDKHKEAPAHEK